MYIRVFGTLESVTKDGTKGKQLSTEVFLGQPGANTPLPAHWHKGGVLPLTHDHHSLKAAFKLHLLQDQMELLAEDPWPEAFLQPCTYMHDYMYTSYTSTILYAATFHVNVCILMHTCTSFTYIRICASIIIITMFNACIHVCTKEKGIFP